MSERGEYLAAAPLTRELFFPSRVEVQLLSAGVHLHCASEFHMMLLAYNKTERTCRHRLPWHIQWQSKSSVPPMQVCVRECLVKRLGYVLVGANHILPQFHIRSVKWNPDSLKSKV